MSSGPFGAVFPGLFGDIFGIGTYPEPPDSLVLRTLRLDATPGSRDQVRSAFRARLRQVHPDLTETTYSAVPSLQTAAESLAMQRPEVAELAWARDVLLRKIPEPVTANQGTRTGLHQPSRSACRKCGQLITGIGGLPATCGSTFTPSRSDGRYCSASCRQKAYRQRCMLDHLAADFPAAPGAGEQNGRPVTRTAADT